MARNKKATAKVAYVCVARGRNLAWVKCTGSRNGMQRVRVTVLHLLQHSP